MAPKRILDPFANAVGCLEKYRSQHKHLQRPSRPTNYTQSMESFSSKNAQMSYKRILYFYVLTAH